MQANIKEIRDKGKEISASSSGATLTHSYLPFLKKMLPQTHRLHSTEFGLFFWLGWGPHLVPLLSFHTPHASLPVWQQWWREDSYMGKTSEEGNRLLLLWAQPGNHGAELLRVHSGNHCISTAPAILSSAACKIPLRKKKWGGGRRSQKNYCVPRGKKNKQPYLAYPALLMSITFLILNRKDTTLVHLFHYLSCYAFPMNCHSCKTCTS